MNVIYRITMLYFLSVFTLFSQATKTYKVITVAFYNLENLFDIENDPITFDDDRTPDGKDVAELELWPNLTHAARQRDDGFAVDLYGDGDSAFRSRP